MKFQFFLRVSNDISASIPSIEEFILQVLLLGDDSEAQTLKKVRRTLQSQPRAVNQILANVLDKGDLWRQKRKEVAVKYRNYLRNIGEAADSDSFVDSLLKNFATELQVREVQLGFSMKGDDFKILCLYVKSNILTDWDRWCR